MRTKIQRWGNSLAVRIPKTFAEEVGLSDDSTIEMRLVKGGLVIEPAPMWSGSLEDLLKEVSDSNLHDENDWGPALGREVW